MGDAWFVDEVRVMAMPTNRVVEHFDVVKDILAC